MEVAEGQIKLFELLSFLSAAFVKFALILRGILVKVQFCDIVFHSFRWVFSHLHPVHQQLLRELSRTHSCHPQPELRVHTHRSIFFLFGQLIIDVAHDCFELWQPADG